MTVFQEVESLFSGAIKKEYNPGYMYDIVMKITSIKESAHLDVFLPSTVVCSFILRQGFCSVAHKLAVNSR